MIQCIWWCIEATCGSFRKSYHFWNAHLFKRENIPSVTFILVLRFSMHLNNQSGFLLWQYCGEHASVKDTIWSLIVKKVPRDQRFLKPACWSANLMPWSKTSGFPLFYVWTSTEELKPSPTWFYAPTADFWMADLIAAVMSRCTIQRFPNKVRQYITFNGFNLH